MKLFCMCLINAGEVPKESLDGQVYEAPNRYGSIKGEDGERSVHLSVDMLLTKRGLRQYVRNDKRHPPINRWPQGKKALKEDSEDLIFSYRRYPNVDVYKCPKCGTEVIFESNPKDSKKIFS